MHDHMIFSKYNSSIQILHVTNYHHNRSRLYDFEVNIVLHVMLNHFIQPDRIKQFGAGNMQHDSWRGDVPHMPGKDLKAVEKDPNPNPRLKDETPAENTEQGAPAGQTHVGYSAALSQLTAGSGARAAQGVPSQDYLNEDYHRNFSSMLGRMVIPR